MSSSNNNNDDNDMKNYCFLQVSIAGGPPERIVIQLFRTIVPKTCDNFVALCSASGRTTPSKPIPTYRGCLFHRIVPQFMVQAGDFTHFTGTGGHAANGTSTFADESFQVGHDRPGIVSMANKGKNTNGSQFFITLQATPHLNKKHVAFGQVVEGMDVVQRMATEVELDPGTNKPSAMQKIVIVDCGLGKGLNESDNSSSEDDTKDNKKKKRKRKEEKAHRKDRHKKKHKKKERKHSSSKRKRRRKHSSDDGSTDSGGTDSGSDNSSTSRRKGRKREPPRSSSSKKRSSSKSRQRTQSTMRSSRDHNDSGGNSETTGSSSSRDSRKRHRKSRR